MTTETHDDDVKTEAPSYEERAISMGWSDKDHWRGDPDRWIDAETFVKNAENHLPLAREQMRRFETRNAELRQELSSLRQGMEEMREFFSKSEQRAYENALRDLRQQHRDAFRAGDEDQFERVEKQMEELQREHTSQAAQRANTTSNGAQSQQDPSQDPAFVAWQSANPWYNEDYEATLYAEQIAPIVSRKGLQGKALLDEVTKLVAKKFPGLFDNPRRDSPAPVASAKGGAGIGDKRTGRTVHDLPSEAKAQLNRFKKEIPGFTDAEYLKHYSWD